MATEVSSLIIRVDTEGAVKSTESLNKLTRTGRKAETQTKSLSTATGQTRKSFKLMRGATQQVGFQVQDMAVQLASGTSVMQAFGQQGSQLASIFGPGGAVIGALIAVGSALVGYATNGKKASEETETLTERIKDLDLAYQDLTATQKVALQLDFAKREQERQEVIGETEEKIRRLQQTIKSFNTAESGLSGTGRFQGLIKPEDVEEAREEIIRLEAAYSGERDRSFRGS